MAKLGDYFREGQKVVADVSYDSDIITNGDKIDIPLAEPVGEDVDVTVLVKEMETATSDHDSISKRLRLDRNTPAKLVNNKFPTTESGTNFVAAFKRNPADTDTALAGKTGWRLEARPGNDTWSNAYTDGWIENEQGYGVELNANVTAGETGWKVCNGQYDGAYYWDTQQFLRYSTAGFGNVFPHDEDGEDKDYDYYQGGRYKERWIGYGQNAPWMTGVNPYDVVFHHWVNSDATSYNQYITGQVVGEINQADGAMRGLGITNNTVTRYNQLPYDMDGTNGPVSQDWGLRCLGKGYKMTEVETGTTLTTSGTTYSFTGAHALGSPYDDWNHYVGAVIKIWDGVDPTSFRIATVDSATGTTSCSVRDAWDWNGYTFADGEQSNYEIWVWYDYSAGDDGYTDIPLFDFPDGTWGHTGRMFFCGFGTGTNNGPRWATETNPVRGTWYEPGNATIAPFAVAYRGLQDLGAGFQYPYGRGYYRQIDWSGVKLRDGTDISSGFPLLPWEMHFWFWDEGLYSPDNGNTWYKSLKDPRAISSNYGRSTEFQQDNKLYWERPHVRWNGSEWQYNDYGDGQTIPDRWEDPAGAQPWYEGTNWVSFSTLPNGALTSFDDMDFALGDWWDWFDGTATFPSEWSYNTRMVNNSDQKKDMLYMLGDYDGWSKKSDYHGYSIESTKSWHQMKLGRSRHILSTDGSYVSIQLGPDFQEDFVYSAKNTSYGRIRIIVKGTPK